MFSLFLLSLIGGILTTLAPCVLPLLPVIIGWSIASESKWRPYIITASLAASVVGFTLLIKVSSLLIDVPPMFWNSLSGGIIIAMGFIFLFPNVWSRLMVALGFENSSQEFLQKSSSKTWVVGAILTGAALGPVFATCSPTYSFLLISVLPSSFAIGVAYMMTYAVGLGATLLAIALLWQKAIKRLKWAANPSGIFRRSIGILFLIVGIGVITGYDRVLQTKLLDAGIFDITKIESQLLDPALDRFYEESAPQ